MAGRGLWRRGSVAVLAWVVGTAGLCVVVEAAGAQAGPLPEVWAPGDDPEAPPWRAGESAPEIVSTGVPAEEFSMPEPGEWEVELSSVGEEVEAGSSPVAVAAGEAAVEDTDLSVRVLAQSAAERADVQGFVFEVTGVSGGLTEQVGSEELPIELSIDYSEFAEAFGGGYSDRLQVVALPSCAVEVRRVTPLCRAEGVRVPAENDTESGRLEVDVEDLRTLVSVESSGLEVEAAPELPESLASAAPEQPAELAEQPGFFEEMWLASEPYSSASSSDSVVLALTAGVSSDTGTWAATPLLPSGEWQVSPGTGEFSWSYDFDVPEAPFGSTPEVNLSYSSGAVDGLVASRNTQSPMAGVGWSDFAGMYIERRYLPCSEKPEYAAIGDLCWNGFNAVISLNGRTSEMVAVDGTNTTWRLKDDPNWRVQRLNHSAANGDNDREFWRVTGPDGTVYDFGLGENPNTGAATGSLWSVPVLADDPGEPCRTAGDQPGMCDQAWRWNLDRVLDPEGVVSTYYYGKDINRYRALGGLGDHQKPYTRGGRLDRIEYATLNGTTDAPSGRVTFLTQYRCNVLNGTCPAPSPSSPESQWPDVPRDLLCSTECLTQIPTFFGTQRYIGVVTEVRDSTGWRSIEQTNIGHTFLENTDGDKKLYLTAIQQVGLSDGTLFALPEVNFWPTAEMPNRIGSGKTMGHFRVAQIIDELGHGTAVTYGQKDPCAANKAATAVWSTNTEDCFPQKVDDVWVAFHKYLTTKVQEIDSTGGSPTTTTSYVYEGAAAWRHADDEFSPTADQSWSDWRGYASTLVINGTALTNGDPATRIRVFRGMNGDRTPSGGVTVLPPLTPSSWTGSTTAVSDNNWLAGQVFEESQVVAVGPTTVVESGTLHRYHTVLTAMNVTDPGDSAYIVVEDETTTSIKASDGSFKRRRSGTLYNNFHQPANVRDEGWVDDSLDDRCTRTRYAVNEPKWMVSYPAEVVAYKGACPIYDGTPANPQDAGHPDVKLRELSRTHTFYDNQTASPPLFGAPTQGNPTKVDTQIDGTTWSTSRSTYDGFGRVDTATDANGLNTDFSHQGGLGGGYPTWTKTYTGNGQPVANAAINQEMTTYWVTGRGVPASITDANGKTTNLDYDDLGRLLAVDRPTEQSTAQWSSEYAYLISPTKSAVPVVRTRRLQSTTGGAGGGPVWNDSWIVYDSRLRERQTQTLNPAASTLVATTVYNSRGQVAETIDPVGATGTPGTAILSTSAWENKSTFTYDQLGRLAATRRSINNGGTAVKRYDTTTTFSLDPTLLLETTKVETDVPNMPITRTGVDALGRTRRVEEYDGTNDGDGTGWRTTLYEYDLADNLKTVTDPAGNVITYQYNKAGWRTSMEDPDAGDWSYTYTPSGLQKTVRDAENQTTWTGYDLRGRPTIRRPNSENDPAVLAQWTYDAAGEKGLPNTTTRTTPVGNWVSDITGYDANNRPTGTTLTVPAGLPGLSGPKTTSMTYDRADHITSVSYPAIGGLPAETVTTVYDAFGLPRNMKGTTGTTEPYVFNANYDDRMRPYDISFGPTGGSTHMQRTWAYDADQRVSHTQLSNSIGVLLRHEYTYDTLGAITGRTTRQGSTSWRECYDLDTRGRLTTAYTVATIDVCDGTDKGSGPNPYNNTYTYTADGNLDARTEGTAPPIDYTYTSGPTAEQPHAPDTVDGDNYTWDNNGNLTQRVVDGQPTNLTWNTERQLASIATPTGPENYTYDSDGQRLLKSTPQGRTLYLGNHEIDANLAGTTITATRTYSFAGQLVATRTGTGTVKYLGNDQQGSIETSGPNQAASDITRAYDPYGKARSGSGQPDTDRGWLGQIEDDTTGLNYLNARYYDPNLHTFISPDPLYDLDSPKSLNPYAYAWGNPITLMDPSGKIPQECTQKILNCQITNDGGLVVSDNPNRDEQGHTISQPPTAPAQQNPEAAALAAMCAENCEPGFWDFIHDFLDVCSQCRQLADLGNFIQGFFEILEGIMNKGLDSFNTIGGCLAYGVDIANASFGGSECGFYDGDKLAYLRFIGAGGTTNIDLSASASAGPIVSNALSYKDILGLSVCGGVGYAGGGGLGFSGELCIGATLQGLRPRITDTWTLYTGVGPSTPGASGHIIIGSTVEVAEWDVPQLPDVNPPCVRTGLPGVGDVGC